MAEKYGGSKPTRAVSLAERESANRVSGKKGNNMKANKAKKKQAKWKLPPTPTTTLTVTPFKTLDETLSYDGSCKCNQKTIDLIGKTMAKLGFVYLDCPFDKDHNVFVPRGLDSTNDQERIAALDAYSLFLHKLLDAGLYDKR